MDEQDQPEEEGYGLILPFVVCASVGGPYDDAAFVAGWECGSIDAALKNAEGTVASFQWQVHPLLVPQIDLVAMHRGFRISKKEPWDEHPDEWVLLSITNLPPEPTDA